MQIVKKLEILLLQLPPNYNFEIFKTVWRVKETSSKRGKLRYNQVSCALYNQRAKKLVSDRPRVVDFAIVLVNSVLNLPDGQVTFFEEFKLQKNCEINSAHQNVFGAS